MKQKLEELKQQFEAEKASIKSVVDLEMAENKYLGRKSGLLTGIMKGLKEMAKEEVAEIGILANQTKNYILSELEAIKNELSGNSGANFDFTVPGNKPKIGHLHLATIAIREIESILSPLGFVRVSHPDVEWDYYAFETLNMPGDHPARDDWETFFIDEAPIKMSLPTNSLKLVKEGRRLLTPHTSSIQVREMEKARPNGGADCGGQGLPIRIMNISKCYRRQIDVSHVPMFHQFEGLVIDQGINITHLKGTVDYFVKKFFGEDRTIRLRPHHFQFTEPSFEVDISCGLCHGTGIIKKETSASHIATQSGGDASHAVAQSAEVCKMCKEGWLELAGAGMVHPNVLKAGGIDPEKYSGFAFGWGVERCFSMKSGLNIDDLRLMYKNDLRFNEQF
jgi:phenylalanyl-tRNA synthetase alpha chain